MYLISDILAANDNPLFFPSNSLILFVVNVNELKERCYTLLELYLQAYFQ